MAKGLNKVCFYEKVQTIAKKEYLGNWKEVWQKFVYPFYPMSYKTFIRIKNTDLKELKQIELKKLNSN